LGYFLLYIYILSRRWEHLHARALQIRAELSTHNHRESGPQRPTHSYWSFLFEKTKLECGKKPPAFRQRQAHNAVRHAARSRPARSAPGHRSRTRAYPVGESVCLSVGVCEGGWVRPPPRERVSRAVAEGRRAECVCEAESELESVSNI